MSAVAVCYRDVICLWHGGHWQTETIACVSELRDDLPRAIEIGYEPAVLTFVLAGFIGETPTYRQA